MQLVQDNSLRVACKEEIICSPNLLTTIRPLILIRRPNTCQKDLARLILHKWILVKLVYPILDLKGQGK